MLDSKKSGKSVEQAKNEYRAEFNLYTQMAHFVGKTLHIRPNEILDTWGVPELIVAYGQYANDISEQNYAEYKQMDGQARAKVGKQDKYAVEFYGLSKLEKE